VPEIVPSPTDVVVLVVAVLEVVVAVLEVVAVVLDVVAVLEAAVFEEAAVLEVVPPAQDAKKIAHSINGMEAMNLEFLIKSPLFTLLTMRLKFLLEEFNGFQINTHESSVLTRVFSNSRFTPYPKGKSPL